MRAKRPTKAGRPRKEERIGPTPETALKHHPDPLQACEAEHQAYGLEIARTHAALTGRLNARAQAYEQRGRSHGDALDKIKSHRIERYNDWRNWLKANIAYPHAVIDIIVEMIPPYVQDRKYWLRPGVSGEWLLMALVKYGKMR
jgi:hypothetical protein